MLIPGYLGWRVINLWSSAQGFTAPKGTPVEQHCSMNARLSTGNKTTEDEKSTAAVTLLLDCLCFWTHARAVPIWTSNACPVPA